MTRFSNASRCSAQNSAPKPENFVQFASISIVRMLADYSMAKLLIRIVHKRLDCTLRISSSRRRLAGAQIAAIFLLQFCLRSLSLSAFRFFLILGSREWKTIFNLIALTIFILCRQQSIAHVTAPKNYFLRLPINLVIRNSNSQPVVKMTAKEFMMGYESPLTTLGNTLLPHWISFDKVGLIDRVSVLVQPTQALR